jgi:hypothetical protein
VWAVKDLNLASHRSRMWLGAAIVTTPPMSPSEAGPFSHPMEKLLRLAGSARADDHLRETVLPAP